MLWVYLAIVLLPMSLFVLAFVVGIFEMHPVAQFREVLADVPDPYTLANVQAAAFEWGFQWRAAGVHTRFATMHAALLLSPERSTIAIIGAGTILKMPSKKTILISRLRDDSLLLTIDEPGTAELDPLTQRRILMNASFAELWQAHWTRLGERAGDIVPFNDEAGWRDVDAIYAARVERMVTAGNARFVDAAHERYRYTLVGSFKASIVHGLRQVFTPRNFLRQLKPRPRASVPAFGPPPAAMPAVDSNAVPPPLPGRR